MLQTGGSGLVLLEEMPPAGGGSDGSIERESLSVGWGADVSSLVLSLGLGSSWEMAAAAAVDDSATVADLVDCDLNSADVFVVENWGSVDSVGAVFWLCFSG